MSKIPFDIKYRPQIESGEYKVETTKGQPVRIICWDRSTTYWKIIGLVLAPDGKTENPFTYDVTGKESDGPLHDYVFDLFIVTPEPEMNEFEQEVYKMTTNKVRFKEEANKLLDLAREQFIKDGYVIEKKAFHDAVEKVEDKHKAKMSVEYASHCKVENGVRHAVMNWDAFQKVAQKFIDIGKAEALKDLPRWKRFRRNSQDYPFFSNCEDGENCLVFDGKYIKMCELMKLPGFKEDEK